MAVWKKLASETRLARREIRQGRFERSMALATGLVPAIMVFEDVHWTDEATLDLVKFLSRRIHFTGCLLILSYRDELAKDHPRRILLGDLPTHAAIRLRLSPLSKAAVTVLAEQYGRAADPLYAVTGGNTFFLTKMFTSDTSGVPLSVSGAVLARSARLSAGARRLLELVSVVPSKVERRVVEEVSAADGAALEECRLAGMLQVEITSIGYRHEIAPRAVEDNLSPDLRRALHAQVLRAPLRLG